MLKNLLKFGAIFLSTFVVIYLLGFFGGWKLFESGNPILMEIGVSFVISLVLWAGYVALSQILKELHDLKDRIETLENQINKS